MSNDFDLQVIKDTFEYMNENCVGPQRANYLFKVMKNKYDSNAFTYSYFISLFNNVEILNKSLVKQVLDNYDIQSNEFKQEAVTDNTTVKPKSAINNKLNITMRRRDKKEYPDSYYYYCTKTQRILKSQVVEAMVQLYAETGENILTINEIYTYLKDKFKVSSFNRANLCEFLKSDKNVPKITIEQLSIAYPPEKEDKNLQLFDIRSFIMKNRIALSNIIKDVGLDYIKYIVSHGLRNIINLYDAFDEFFDRKLTNMELKDQSNDQLFNDYNRDLIVRFLDLFAEEELIVALENEEYIEMYLEMFIDDEQKKIEKEKFVKQLSDSFEQIEESNLKAKSKYIFPFELVPFFNKEQIKYLKDIKNVNKNKFVELYPFRDIAINYTKVLKQSLTKYLNERFKFVLQRVNASYVPNSLWEKYVEVMLNRERGLNLEETSKIYDTSRERVRQIENKYIVLFNDLYNSQNGTLTRLIRAFAGNDYYLTIEDISGIISFYPQLFVYLLKKIEVPDLLYIEELNVFEFLDENDWYKELLVISESLPDIISADELNSKVKNTFDNLAKKGMNIPYEYCDIVIKADFKLNGTQYSRHKIGLTTKYKKILETYFPSGMTFSDQNDIQLFRNAYAKIYGDNQIANNDRALCSRISAVAYLVGKGKYAVKKDYYISDELANKIYNYIMDSDREIFLTNTLYYIFEEDLKREGVNNKYHLQGIIKELYGDKLFTSRDYISKSDDKTSIYSDVYDFVKEVGREITFDEIKDEFVGVPDFVLGFALNNDNILNIRKAYIHVDNLKIENKDIDLLREIINRIVADEQIHHCNDLFGVLDFKYKSILTEYNIDNQFKLFSYVAYLFADEYELQRPFIAKKGIKIGHQKERINEYVRNYDELRIKDFWNFIYDNKLHVNSMIEYIFDEVKGEYALKDKETIISVEKARINKYNAMTAETVLLNAMENDDFIAASKFKGYNFLSSEVKWTEWLLASAINIYSSKIKIIITDNKLSSADVLFVKASVPANNIDELKAYLKDKNKFNDIEFIQYLKQKGIE